MQYSITEVLSFEAWHENNKKDNSEMVEKRAKAR